MDHSKFKLIEFFKVRTKEFRLWKVVQLQ